MPELPEVETIRIGLDKLIKNKQVKDVSHDWPKSFPNSETNVKAFLIGSKILSVKRRAKVLIIDLSSGYSLLIHLKMTGQLVYRSQDFNFGAGHPSDSLVGELPDKSTRVEITFSDSSKLYFNDQRKFGWMRLFPTIEIGNIDFFKKLGPEPLNKDFSWQDLKLRLIRRKNSSIKAAILDQSIVAGIGNIYADESLWGAKIHPSSLVRQLSNAKIKDLHKEIVYVLKLSIEKGGSSDKNYINAEGKKGSYLSFARVFRREGLACPRCGNQIKKIRVANRGTHYCPYCQRLVK
jgi:formamidopyrimidine-DNA glycosylase